MDAFDREKLDVYKTAMEFAGLSDAIVRRLPRGRAYLAEQLHRAATSIPFNIAEGAGEYSRREKAPFYRIARRSATESAAMLDVCGRLKLADGSTHAEGRETLLRIVSMLTKMVRGFEGEPDVGTDAGGNK
ncbi:MAG TPA: four helix bundle protein [Candidatus Methylomirabilis sp.]|jgi:four helix bundle protein